MERDFFAAGSEDMFEENNFKIHDTAHQNIMNMRRMQPATMMLALLSSSMVLVVTAELKNLTVYRVTPKNVTQSGEFLRNGGEVVQIYSLFPSLVLLSNRTTATLTISPYKHVAMQCQT